MSEPSCDACALDDLKCPGQEVHCARGQHCTSTIEVCALEWRSGENPGGHPRTCEDCGAELEDRTR